MKKTTVVKLPKALSDPKYKGKHLLLVESKVMAAGRWQTVSRALGTLFGAWRYFPVLIYRRFFGLKPRKYG